MKTLQSLRREADHLLRTGDYEGALRRYHALLALEPRAHDARMGIGDALVGLGHHPIAAQVYRATAWAFAQAGHPLRALVAAKAMEAIDATGDSDTARITRLFAADSPRIGGVGASRPIVALEGGAPTTAVLEAGDVRDVVRSAAAEAVELPAMSVTLAKLAPAPLFSEIEAAHAQSLTRAAEVVRLADAEPCVVEGEPPDAVYLVARGRLALSLRGRPIGFAEEGSLVGEEPLVGPPGALASAWASGDVDLVRIPYDAITRVSFSSPAAEEVLGRIFRSYFLQSLLRSCPIFRGLSEPERLQVLEAMPEVVLPEGATLLTHHDPAPGVWIVLSGRVRVHATAEDSADQELLVWPGGLVGLTSSLTGEPSYSSAVVATETTVLFLGAATLRGIADRHPDVRHDLVEEAFARRSRPAPGRSTWARRAAFPA